MTGVVVPSPIGSASAFHAAQLVRLLAGTVDVVADGWGPLADVAVLQRAVQAAGTVLLGLFPTDDPEAVGQALDRLAAVVAELPGPGS